VVGAFVVLCVALVVAAILGVGNDDKSAADASTKGRTHPVPFRVAAPIGGGWKMKVLSVRRNAN
jgi:hypothetical protein